MEHSKIEWCHHTFNPWWGCDKVSAGCKNCYAEKQDARFGDSHWGANSERKFMSSEHWKKPMLWNKKAEAAGERQRVFCASMADVLEVLPMDHPSYVGITEARARLWQLIDITPSLDWLILTKRPENFHFVPRYSNIWIGVTAENQEQADVRVPLLLKQNWATVRFVSHEPALEPVNLENFVVEAAPMAYTLLSRYYGNDGFDPDGSQPERKFKIIENHGIDWLITGAESGPGARPMHEDSVRIMREQCAAAKIPFFYKQRLEDGKKISLPLLDGRRHIAFPEAGKAEAVPDDSTEGEGWTATLCPQCGPDVKVDEDGCCVACGCVSMGEGVERIARERERFATELNTANVAGQAAEGELIELRAELEKYKSEGVIIDRIQGWADQRKDEKS